MKEGSILYLLVVSGVLSVFSAGLFGSFGALAHYLYTLVKKDLKFNFVTMATFFILGFFISVLINAITIDVWGKSWNGVSLLSGFLVIRILDFIDASGLGIILKRLGIKIEKV